MYEQGNMRSYLFFGVVILCGAGVAHAESEPVRLESPDPVVGSITIENGSIFDLEDPEENNFLYRLANKAHATTRPQVIEQQLLFEPGDEFSSQALAESERILRGNRYLQKAQIEAVPNATGSMDIKVSTADTWTLIPKLSLSRSGGENSSAFGVKEMNLLGTGIGLEAAFKSDVDRDSKVLKIVDNNIGDSWYRGKVMYEDNSDGQLYHLQLGKPFYAMDTVRAHGISLFDNDRTESLYDRGEIAAQFQQKTTTQEIFFGRSKGLQNGWVRRYTAGLGYDENRFAEVPGALTPSSHIPDDRKLVYPFVGIEIIQDKFDEGKNYDQVARVEDRFLGTAFNARVGFAGRGFGSDRDALLIDAGVQTSFSRSQKSTVFLTSDFSTRIEDGQAANTMLGMDAKYYRRQSDKRLLYAQLSGEYGANLDLDQNMYLGGDTGLRGYPLRYQNGDKRALFTLEQRFFTDWYPFRLFHVGAAVFFDAGRTWGEGPFGNGSDGLLRDVGAGLRLGNSRSGLGQMVHIDIAYPLDGDDSISNVQLIVQTKVSF